MNSPMFLTVDHDLAASRHALGEDDVLVEITHSKPFRRLQEISFLGAIDYLDRPSSDVDSLRTRACHSLDVAALADFVARGRRYSSEMRRHVTAAALLHDIGHSPLSHSVEPYFKEQLGWGHHELGMSVLDGASGSSRKLAVKLRKHFDVELLKALIAGEAPAEQGGDLFASPINIDTIEGIWRSVLTVKGSAPVLKRSSVARAAFLQEPCTHESTNVLDKFWKLKHYAYNDLIHSNSGIAADSYALSYFRCRNETPKESWLMATEKDWQSNVPELFSNLLSLDASSPAELAPVQDYTARAYWIDDRQEGMQRYQVTKAPASIKIRH